MILEMVLTEVFQITSVWGPELYSLKEGEVVKNIDLNVLSLRKHF